MDLSSFSNSNNQFTVSTSQLINNQSAEIAAKKIAQQRKETVTASEKTEVAKSLKTEDENFLFPKQDKLSISNVIQDSFSRKEAVTNLSKLAEKLKEENDFQDFRVNGEIRDILTDTEKLVQKDKSLGLDFGRDEVNKFSQQIIESERERKKLTELAFQVRDTEDAQPVIPEKKPEEIAVEIKKEANEKVGEVASKKKDKELDDRDKKVREAINQLNEVDLRELNEKEKETPTEKSIDKEDLNAFAKRAPLTESLLDLTDLRLEKLKKVEEKFEEVKERIRELEDSSDNERLVEARENETSDLTSKLANPEASEEEGFFDLIKEEELQVNTISEGDVKTQADAALQKNEATLSNSFDSQVDKTKLKEEGTSVQQVAADASKKQDDNVDKVVQAVESREPLAEKTVGEDSIATVIAKAAFKEKSEKLGKVESAFDIRNFTDTAEKLRFEREKEVVKEEGEVADARKDFTNEQSKLTIKDKEIFPTELSAYAVKEGRQLKVEAEVKEKPFFDVKENRNLEERVFEKKLQAKFFEQEKFLEKKEEDGSVGVDKFV